MKHIISLSNKKVLIDSIGSEDNTILAIMLQLELMNLGFILSTEAFDKVKFASKNWYDEFSKEGLNYLKTLLSVKNNYKPLYKNFPDEVINSSEEELFLNAFHHYSSNGTWIPPENLNFNFKKFSDSEIEKCQRLSLANDLFLSNYFYQLASINQSLAQREKDHLTWLVKNVSGLKIKEEDVPFKETKCLLVALGFPITLKTPTDVLRFAVYKSNGDISLPSIPSVVDINKMKVYFIKQNTIAQKFKKFTRSERKQILNLLEKTSLDLSEMQIHLGRWLRLGEILHPGEYKNKFPKTFNAFNELRNQGKNNHQKIKTFNSEFLHYLNVENDLSKALDKLKTKPGEFARKLDWLVRTYDKKTVLEKFSNIADKISVKVLIELHNHFSNRCNNIPRVVSIKGIRTINKTLKPLDPLPEKLINDIKLEIELALYKKFINLPSLGKVWIDSRLGNIPLPTNMRNASENLNSYTRGTKVSFDETAKVIRSFVHWNDELGKIDLDLSAAFYDFDLNRNNTLSYSNLKISNINCYHSGDIRHRVGPCAEYIDVDIEACLGRNIRYVIPMVFNYDHTGLKDIKECVFGVMERNKPESNKTFIPSTIENCIKISSDGNNSTICALDLVERCFIWLDINNSSGNYNSNIIENTSNIRNSMIGKIILGKQLSIKELLTLHGTARGTIVDNKDEADIKFEFDDFITDYTKIGEYLK